MTRRGAAIVLALAWTMSACHSTPPKQQPPSAPADSAAPMEAPAPPADSNAAPPSTEAPPAEPAEIPPCVPAEAPKPAPKPKPKPVVRAEPPPQEPPTGPPPPASGEASVKLTPSPSASILGKKVRGQDGDDLGRVVDVLADTQGHVHIAIIEFGGFLGVGDRRIAVDWSLLKFHPEDPDAAIVVNASRRKLQGTPEYKGSERPLALTAPEAPPSPQPTTPK
jgi:hypothetical protein